MLHRIAAVAFVSAFAAGCQPAAAPPDPNLARLVDQQAIAQLIAGTYPHALDTADFDGYAALHRGRRALATRQHGQGPCRHQGVRRRAAH